jgi:hypothetical protein
MLNQYVPFLWHSQELTPQHIRQLSHADGPKLLLEGNLSQYPDPLLFQTRAAHLRYEILRLVRYGVDEHTQ